MSRNYIFCFSGSGNCLDIAKNVAAQLGDCDIVSMRRMPEVTDVRGAERVGFIFPCYAGGMPAVVEEHVKAVQMDPGCYKFGIVSCAAYPGIGLSVIDKLVGGLDYAKVISHQCSCIWLFPHDLMMPKLNAEEAQERSEQLAMEAGLDLLEMKKTSVPRALAFNKLEAKAWPKLSGKKAALLNADQFCIHCGVCAKICPKGNIKMVDGRPEFGTDCIGCLSCLQYCSAHSINMGGVTKKRERYHNVNVTAEELNQAVIHVD